MVLLQGTTGVGRRYTVECLAQSTGRPLLSLIMPAQIDDLEKYFKYWFKLAERWNAIVLIEEDDILLQMRAKGDPKRVGTVP